MCFLFYSQCPAVLGEEVLDSDNVHIYFTELQKKRRKSMLPFRHSFKQNAETFYKCFKSSSLGITVMLCTVFKLETEKLAHVH